MTGYLKLGNMKSTTHPLKFFSSSKRICDRLQNVKYLSPSPVKLYASTSVHCQNENCQSLSLFNLQRSRFFSIIKIHFGGEASAPIAPPPLNPPLLMRNCCRSNYLSNKRSFIKIGAFSRKIHSIESDFLR